MTANPPPSARAPVSAVVVSYNRAATIETCLAALGFADEVLLIDKSSTDGTAERALALADRVIRVPHSPTVEETRAFAAAQATHEWVLLLDDDECLNAAAVRFIAAELFAPRAEVYALPLRHYILGCHDPRAYYWPEWHPRLFRRGAVAFAATVHRGISVPAGRVFQVPVETGVAIHHLSHRSVFEWIDKTNRYTSRPDRARAGLAGTDLAAFAHAAIERWRAAGVGDGASDGMEAAVALLRASYDIIDRLKTWEEERGLDGEAAFAAVRATLRAEYAGLADLARPHGAAAIEGDPAPGAVPAMAEPARVAAAQASILAALRAEIGEGQAALAAARADDAAARAAAAAERARLDTIGAALREAVAAAAAARDAAAARAMAAEAALGAMQASTLWRATGPLRRLGARHRLVARFLGRGARVLGGLARGGVVRRVFGSGAAPAIDARWCTTGEAGSPQARHAVDVEDLLV